MTHTSEDPVATYVNLQYSRKYWQELNLAVEPQIPIAKILADLIWWFSKGVPYVLLHTTTK